MFVASTYAESTKASYRTHLRTYLRFCVYFKLEPVPITQSSLIAYIAYLARSLKPASINCYLNIIRLLHLDAGLANPLEGNFEVANLKKGIARQLGSPPIQKLPITCEILRDIRKFLNFTKPADICFWSACIFGFFGFLRKKTLLPVSMKNFGVACLLRGDVSMPNYNTVIVNKGYKNNPIWSKVVGPAIHCLPWQPFMPSQSIQKLVVSLTS